MYCCAHWRFKGGGLLRMLALELLLYSIFRVLKVKFFDKFLSLLFEVFILVLNSVKKLKINFIHTQQKNDNK